MSKPEMVPMPDLYRCDCGKLWDLQKVRAVGVHCERWRFRESTHGDVYLAECPDCPDYEAHLAKQEHEENERLDRLEMERNARY